MVLLGIRDNLSGDYYGRSSIRAFAAEYHIPLVRVYPSTSNDAAAYIESIRSSKDLDEGVVISWPNLMVTVVLADNVDDLLPLLSDDDRNRLIEFVDSFWEWKSTLACSIGAMYIKKSVEFDTKKDLAISDWAKEPGNRKWMSIIFSIWDGKTKSADEAVDKLLDAALKSETKWNEFKASWGVPLDWNEMEEDAE
jgi:hypothetical protein